MFDMGFAELLLIGVIGLLVLGPERLPVAVRTVTLWMRRLRRSFNTIRADIERELHAEELKAQIHNDTMMESFREAENELREGVDAMTADLPDTPYDVSDILGPERGESGEDNSETEKPRS